MEILNNKKIRLSGRFYPCIVVAAGRRAPLERALDVALLGLDEHVLHRRDLRGGASRPWCLWAPAPSLRSRRAAADRKTRSAQRTAQARAADRYSQSGHWADQVALVEGREAAVEQLLRMVQSGSDRGPAALHRSTQHRPAPHAPTRPPRASGGSSNGGAGRAARPRPGRRRHRLQCRIRT
jgi:hypothetical protein